MDASRKIYLGVIRLDFPQSWPHYRCSNGESKELVAISCERRASSPENTPAAGGLHLDRVHVMRHRPCPCMGRRCLWPSLPSIMPVSPSGRILPDGETRGNGPPGFQAPGPRRPGSDLAIWGDAKIHALAFARGHCGREVARSPPPSPCKCPPTYTRKGDFSRAVSSGAEKC